MKFGRFFRRRVSKMTVEPFISRVYAFLIFPCASVASYALPPTIVRSYAYQTFISPVSTSIRSYEYQTFILPVLVDTRLSYVRNSSKRRMLNFRNRRSYGSRTYNEPLVIVWYTAVVCHALCVSIERQATAIVGPAND